MWREIVMLCLAGALVLPAFAEEELYPEPARLANGMPVDGVYQQTTAQGITFQTPKGIQVLPWKYLSTGTRYRFEGAFLARKQAAKINAAQQASTTNTALPADGDKAVPLVAPSPASARPVSSNVLSEATNAPPKD